MTRRLAALVLALGASGCVTLGRGRQMEARIQRLEGESDVAARKIDEQREVIRQRVSAVDKKIDELNTAAHRSGADLAVNQDKLQDENRRLSGAVEELTHRLEEAEKGLAQQKSETDGRFAALKGSGALQEYEAREKARQLGRPTSKSEFLALAREQEAKGERAVAREIYEEYVKKWPSDARSADAHFRLGELWFGDRRYREAILEYGKVAQDFPRSDKAPDALLRTGESMLALDLRDDARKLFEEVGSRYPNSTAAQRAKARLAETRSGKATKKK